MNRPILKFTLLVVAGLMAACSGGGGSPASVSLVDDQPVQQVVSITPSPTFTPFPTVGVIAPTVTFTPMPSPTPVVTVPTQDVVDPETCGTMLYQLWSAAGQFCLGGPDGFACNGGIAPYVEPAGPVSNALATAGSNVQVDAIHVIRTSPIMTSGNSAGVLWMRLGKYSGISALLVGDVEVQDVGDSSLPVWSSILVETDANSPKSLCGYAPHGAFIAQSPLGTPARFIANGVSVDLDGTVVIQTQNDDTGLTTSFTAISGRVRVIARGAPQVFYAGQEVIVPYAAGDLNSPSDYPGAVAPLDETLIRNLPVSLLDRPVLLPQPGVVSTEGGVNLRAEPSTDGRFLQLVPAGETLAVLGRSIDSKWLHVQLSNGDTGWMFAELLRQSLGQITAVYDETPMPPERYGELGVDARVIAAAGANVREAPLADFDVITTLPFGTQVSLLGRSPYSPWVRVRSGDVTGWVALITLETTTSINLLPIDYDVPPPPPPTPVPVYGDNAFPDPNGGG